MTVLLYVQRVVFYKCNEVGLNFILNSSYSGPLRTKIKFSPRLLVYSRIKLHLNCYFGSETYGWVGGWVGGWMNGWMDGWMDGRTDGETGRYIGR
jgi:hypothetical protein